MRTVSDAFIDAMRNGGEVVTRATLYRAGVPIAEDLPVTEGLVTVDKTAAIRRTCTWTVVDETGVLVPTSAGDALTPYGNEIKIWRGYRLPGGDELLPLGVFRIYDAEVQQQEGGAVIIAGSGRDRADAVIAAKFTDAYIIGAGQDVAEAIAALVSDGVPGTVFRFPAGVSGVTPQLVYEAGDDRWEKAAKLAESIGCTIYYDPDGECVIAEEPAIGAAPDFEYAEGETATVLSVGKAFAADPGYNGAIVIGESTSLSAPVRGEAWDTDPLSPTYYLGPYGKRPQVVRSEYPTSGAMATTMATGIMRRDLGGTELVTFSAIPNPAHEADDAVLVVASAAMVSETGLLEHFTIPLGHDGAMSATSRRRRAA